MRDEERVDQEFCQFLSGEGECRRKQMSVFCEMHLLREVWRFFLVEVPARFRKGQVVQERAWLSLIPYTYTFRMSLPSRTVGKRLAQSSIIPIPITRSGNNKPKSLQKTKRTFKPNLTHVDWPVTVLGGPVPIDRTKEQSLPKLEGILMQVKKIRDVEKAGGIEGLLVGIASIDCGCC